MNTGGGVIDRVAAWGERQLLRPVGFVFERVERGVDEQLDEVAEKLPEPPVWLVPVILVVASVVTAWTETQEQNGQPEQEPQAVVEPTTTNGVDDDLDEALSQLDYQRPPMPERWEVEEEYRQKAIEAHPDHGGDAEEFKRLYEAWELLAEHEELSGSLSDDRGN